jgi:LPS O-antigen subunit length determinant protein (WzzB/FepE family)
MVWTAGKGRGLLRSLYSGLVVIAAVALAFVAVALTLAFN